ncbi:MAG: hypothetical protein QM820_36700 [Minicystis sp.]
MSAPGCTVAEDGTVTFEHRNAAAGAVLVAGDFTGWGRAPIPLRRVDGTDRWTAAVKIPGRGLHTYKYLVDGSWIPDPANRLFRDDGFDGRNSAFVVGARAFGGPGAVRVASLNLHTYQEPDPLDKLEQIAIAMTVMEVDLLLLQEVGEHVSDPARPNAGEQVRRHLEALTGKPWHHAWREAHIGFDVYREGESVIASAPLEDVTTLQLSDKGLARIALLATTTIKGVTLRVGTTHISWEPDAAEAEASKLLAALDDTGGRSIDATLIAGDFNCHGEDRPIRRFRERGFSDVGATAGVVGPTFLAGPDGRIDFHLLRGGPGRPAPRVEAFARVFDGDERNGYQPRVSDHAGLIGAYAWGAPRP